MKDLDFIPESYSGSLIGAVLMPRDIGDLKLWQRKPFTAGHALADLFLISNNDYGQHKLSGGMVVEYKPGWCLWSNKALAERWGWRREEVERFLTELERVEIISRHDIGQSRKAIILLHYVQQNGSRTAADGHATGTVRDRVSETETETELKNFVPVEVAIAQFVKLGNPAFTADEIRGAWMALTTSAVDGYWMTDYSRPPRPVSDWRVALENQIGIRRQIFGSKKNSARPGDRDDGEAPPPMNLGVTASFEKV